MTLKQYPPGPSAGGPSARSRNLNDLDDRERLSAEINRLQRALLRLAFAFYGSNPELDQQLARLGNAVRGGDKKANLPKMIDDVVSTVADLDLARRKHDPHAGASLLGNLIDKLAMKMGWDHSSDSRLAALKRDLAAKPDERRIAELTEECARFISAHAGAPSQPPPAQPQAPDKDAAVATLKIGFDRFLAGLSLPDGLVAPLKSLRERIRQAQEQLAIMPLVEEAARLLSEQITGPQRRGEDAPGADLRTELARTVLLDLLNTVILPVDLFAQAQMLRIRVSRVQGAEEMRRLGGDIGLLMQAAQTRLQGEIEELGDFLRQVMDGLEALRVQMQVSHQSRCDALRDSEALSRSVGDHMRGIHDSVELATDIQHLKVSICAEIETIRHNVEAFVTTARQRHDETEDAVSKLSVQLQELEGETMRLREGIKRERSRAVKDPLTNVSNRLGFEEYMGVEVKRWQRDRDGLILVLIDVDHFKTINDHYGHQAGDKVLKTIVEQFRGQVRQSDFLARYGGEEFVLVLPRATLKDGCQIAEKLRRHIEDCKFHHRSDVVPVTVSCGVAEFREGDTLEGVFERADRALYVAKSGGRNRCQGEQDIAWVIGDAGAGPASSS